ncbi:RHS repeat-associated protein [Pantoea anthophila]|nr:RHS repeat-associated protein [Pantoea anthophila]
MHKRVTALNGIRWRYRYDGEHRLTEVISDPRDRNKPRTKVSFRYDPLGRRISKTSQQLLQGRPSGNAVTTRFVWEGYRLLQEIHDVTPLTYVYSDSQSYEPLARIDGVESPEIYWFHNAANGMPELLTDAEGQKAWEGINSPWGKLLRESSQRLPAVQQNLRMQGQYLDRETGLHYNLFRHYDPDSGRFTQQDPIGLAGGINLYQYAPNALGWVDPWGLSRCSLGKESGRYSAIKPGPLDKELAETFSGGRYKEIILSKDTSFYRAGVSTNPFGRFFSLDKPQSIIQTRVDKAVLPKWPNGSASVLDSVYEIKIPAGTKVYVGDVGYQNGFYLGGTEQIVIIEPWKVGTVIGKWPLL